MPKAQKQTQEKQLITGKISLTGKGIGYLVSDERDGDIEIAPRFLRTALHRDTVKVLPHVRLKNGRETGEVVEVIRRAKRGFAGVLRDTDGVYWVSPDDSKMIFDIVIPKEKLLGAEPGEKVFVSITKWNDRRDPPIGRVDFRLGKPGDNEAEMRGIALERGFASNFPQAVEEEAQEIYRRGITDDETKARRDCRGILTCTIDPADAKDFDDALSFKRNDDGTIEIGVHIADVSHYVSPGSAIDQEAYERATSVYLVDRTIPMLPEVLSNDLCSLRPNEDRLAFSIIFTVNESFDVTDTWIGRTIINSDKRLTYEEAQKYIEGAGTDALAEAVRTMNDGAKRYQADRFKHGALNLDQDEVVFKLNESGEPIDVTVKERKDAHRMIEEWMLLANRYIARFGAGPNARSPWQNNNPLSRNPEATGTPDRTTFLYRIHGLPDAEKMRDLALFLEKVGFSVELKEGRIPPKVLNDITDELEGHPEKNAIETMIVRTMAKAVYEVLNIGHYGLAFPFYTHFTSPIRRYPDLIVHRMVAARLQEKPTPKSQFGSYKMVAAHCSDRERDAQDAERSSVKYKQVEYMTKHIGEQFEGVITGVTEWGIFVEEMKTKAEGMIRLSDINDDYYTLDEKTLTLVGSKTGKEYRIGQVIPIKVADTDLEEKLIDYTLVT